MAGANTLAYYNMWCKKFCSTGPWRSMLMVYCFDVKTILKTYRHDNKRVFHPIITLVVSRKLCLI
jgi:hypothetical protein